MIGARGPGPRASPRPLAHSLATRDRGPRRWPASIARVPCSVIGSTRCAIHERTFSPELRSGCSRAGGTCRCIPGASRRGPSTPSARRVQTGSQAADQRRVLHRTAAARSWLRRVALDADVRDQPGERLDRACVRAAAHQPDHPPSVRVCGTAQLAMGCGGATRSRHAISSGRRLIAATASRPTHHHWVSQRKAQAMAAAVRALCVRISAGDAL